MHVFSITGKGWNEFLHSINDIKEKINLYMFYDFLNDWMLVQLLSNNFLLCECCNE